MLASMAVALALLLAAATPLDCSQAQTVSVVATEYSFAPSRLTFRAGVPYRIHLENRGKELHEFTAPAFLKTVELGNPDALNAERTDRFTLDAPPARFPASRTVGCERFRVKFVEIGQQQPDDAHRLEGDAATTSTIAMSDRINSASIREVPAHEPSCPARILARFSPAASISGLISWWGSARIDRATAFTSRGKQWPTIRAAGKPR